MTGTTHRAGGALASIVGFWALKNSGLLLSDVNEGLQLLIMYPFTLWGSVASDLDHHWESAPSKDIASLVINKGIHLTTPVRRKMKENGKDRGFLYGLLSAFDAKHRSWQTHSDLTLALILLLLWQVMNGRFNSTFSVVDVAITSLVLMGICMGIVAHLILDMLTPQGVWSTVFVVFNRLISLVARKEVSILPEKIHFVPNISFFATGGIWERWVCRLLKISTVISVVYVIGLLMLSDGWQTLVAWFPYEISIS